MDDESERTLFCGNLDNRVTEELLYELFLQVCIAVDRIPLFSLTGKMSGRRHTTQPAFEHNTQRRIWVYFWEGLSDQVQCWHGRICSIEIADSDSKLSTYSPAQASVE